MNACFGWMFSLISLFLMSNLVNEITEERNKSNLSKEQVEIFFDYVKGHSFDKIRASYGLSCNNVVIRVVIRTIQLKHWYFNHKGGNDPYLSKKDLDTFCDSICSYADDINCITCSCSIQLAHDIKNTRIKKAILFLHSIQKNNLIKKCRINKIFLYFYRMFTETTYRLAGVERSQAKRRRSRDPAAGGKNR